MLAMLTVLSVLAMSFVPVEPDPAAQRAQPTRAEGRAMGVGGYVPDMKALNLEGAPTGWRSGRGNVGTVIAPAVQEVRLCEREWGAAHS
jgi:hypothetical protein